ncbi:hypothetical protein [Streptomyces nigrescens]
MDGRDDWGIDAVAVEDRVTHHHITLVQAKWSDKANSGSGHSEVHRLFRGLDFLLNLEFSRFNNRVERHVDALEKGAGQGANVVNGAQTVSAMHTPEHPFHQRRERPRAGAADTGRIRAGVPHGHQDGLSAPTPWIATAPDRGRAVWRNDTARPLVWEADGEAYAASPLVRRMRGEAMDKHQQVQGTLYWHIPGEGSLYDIAKELRAEDGVADSEPSNRVLVRQRQHQEARHRPSTQATRTRHSAPLPHRCVPLAHRSASHS